MNYSELFRVKPGNKVKLDDIDPNFTAKHENQNSALPKLEKYTQKLRDLQYLLYAEGKQSLLICLQALDAGVRCRQIVNPDLVWPEKVVDEVPTEQLAVGGQDPDATPRMTGKMEDLRVKSVLG